MAESRSGFEVVFLLGGTFRQVIDDLHRALAAQGHADARPIHGFALQAIGPHGVTISELARRLGVSKQAAAKTVRSLEHVGYVTRHQETGDRRAVLLQRTERAEDLLAHSVTFFAARMDAWRMTLGHDRFETMVGALAEIGDDTNLGDFPGWLGQ